MSVAITSDLAGATADVAIFEPNADGHRLFYVGRLLAEVSASTRVKVFTSEQAMSSAEADVHLPDVGPEAAKFEYVAVCAVNPTTLASRRSALRAALADLETGMTLAIPDADHLLLALLRVRRPRGTRVTLLLMRPSASGVRRMARHLCKVLLVNYLCRVRGYEVFRLAPPLSADASPGPRGLRRARVVEDPLPAVVARSAIEARHVLNLSPDRIVVLVAGRIDQRKSIAEIMAWMARSQVRPRPVLLLAGEVPSDVRALIESTVAGSDIETSDILILDGYVSEDLLSLAYSACDCIAVLYENRGSSGVVSHALVHQRPVLAWGNQDVTEMVRRLGIGMVLSGRTPEQIDSAVAALRQLPWPAETNALVDLRRQGYKGLQAMLR